MVQLTEILLMLWVKEKSFAAGKAEGHMCLEV